MSKYFLKFIWSEKYLGICLDQKVSNKSLPLSEYFFWPRTDAWELLHVFIDSKSWISHKDTVLVLNTLTDVIHFWQDCNKQGRNKDISSKQNCISEAKLSFPSCSFVAFN